VENSFDVGVRAFVSLITLINPLCVGPLFLSLTREQTLQQRNVVALKGILIALCLLLTVSFSGDLFFHFIGISFSSFKIVGGFLLFLSGINMVTGTDSNKSEAASVDISVFPLGIPLIAGPGAMTAGITFVAEAQGDPTKICTVIAAILSVFFLNWLCMNQVDRLVRLLGHIGLDIFLRIFGIVTATIAMELMISGIQVAFHLG
jgi:multiple antibiotic resistance protein